jgi:competence protein ComEA
MTRLLIALLTALSVLSLITAGLEAQGTSATDLMKKAGDAKKLAGPLDLNSASLDDLKKLPGIGEADATKIVGGRPFAKTSDLVDKKILSPAVYDKVKHLVTVVPK